jgi:hypothetical protein
MISSLKLFFNKISTNFKYIFEAVLKNKRLRILALIMIVLIGIFAVLLQFAPNYLAKNLKKPEITKAPGLFTNQEIQFEGKGSIMAYYKDRPYWPAKNYSNKYNFGKLEGPQSFKVYSYIEILGLGRIKSTEYVEYNTTGDYSAPIFNNLEIKKAYPKKDNTFTFVTKESDLLVKNNEDLAYEPNNQSNKCTQAPFESNFKYTCPINFGENKELTLNYSIVDKAGNSTKITDNQVVKNVELPVIECIPIPEITTKTSLETNCKTNKKGTINDATGQIALVEKDQNTTLLLNLKEGDNIFTYTFKDIDGFDINKEFKTKSDTTAPTITFTFLDVKKKFNQGSFTLKFKPSETADTKVVVRPYNETFENDPRFKEPQLAKTWGYKGGASYLKTVIAGEEESFVTPNDLGGCQIYENPSPSQNLVQVPQGYCSFYNVFFVKTDIVLTDKAGNSSQYQCTSYTWDENKNPAGDLPTECKKI